MQRPGQEESIMNTRSTLTRSYRGSYPILTTFLVSFATHATVPGRTAWARTEKQEQGKTPRGRRKIQNTLRFRSPSWLIRRVAIKSYQLTFILLLKHHQSIKLAKCFQKEPLGILSFKCKGKVHFRCSGK